MINNIHGVQIGDIFYTSWGYEQTNIDFFEVVAVTEKMATVRPIKDKRTETFSMQGKVEPIPGEYITGHGFYKDTIRTKTENWSNNGGQKILRNADGHDHIGWLYTGGSINYTEYA